MLARNAEDLLGRWLRGGTELNDLHPRTP
jgi:hypothetical protein